MALVVPDEIVRKTMADIIEPTTESKTSSTDARGHWQSKTEFLLSCIGMVVGLGNLWRFPYLAYKNGGAAFIIVYVIIQALIGNPLFFMELALGQYSGRGPTLLFRCNPMAKGVGISMMAASTCIVMYYPAVLGLCLFYLFASMQSELPWTQCQPEWLPYDCWVYGGAEGYTLHTCGMNHTNITNHCKCSRHKAHDFNFDACPDANYQLLSYDAIVGKIKDNTVKCSLLACINITKAPGHFYLYNVVLERTNSTLSNIGTPLWDMSLCLVLVWVVAVLACMKGINEWGKVVYFTVLVPYIIIVAMIAKMATLPGSVAGLKYLFLPEWRKILDLHVWLDAGSQVFFSLGVSTGPLIALGSYNEVHNDCFMDSIVVTFADLGTSIFAGILVFMMLGAKSFQQNVPFEEVAQPAYGLVFVTCPDVLARLSYPQIWSALFFLMLFSLGIDSLFGTMECVVSVVTDEFPKLLKHRPKVVVTVGVCFCVLGLPIVCPGGEYVLAFLDNYAFVYTSYFICLSELAAIIWMYDVIRLMKDMHYMLGYRPWPAIYWIGCWTIVAPLLVIIIALGGMYTYEPLTYIMGVGTAEHSVRFELWTEPIGWLITCGVLLPIPTVALWVVYHSPGDTLKERCMNAKKIDPLWQPQDRGTQEDHVTYIK